MTLDDRDIIQVDATVIAGALVLLTLTLTFGTLKASENAQQAIKILLTLVIIAPFSLSAIFVIFENLQEKNKGKLRRLSLQTMSFGFALIIFFFMLLMSFYICPNCWK